MYNVICVGSATVDVFAHTESELIKIKTQQMEEDLIAYPSGSKILIEKLEFKVGGGGTNTAVSFSKLGMKTAYLGKLGSDENANQVLALLKKEKIDFVGIKGKEQTGYSIILDSIEDDRTILTNKGANNNLLFSELNTKKIKSNWYYFSSMMGKSLKTLERLTKFASKNKINIAFNPSSYLIKENIVDVKKILKNTKVLIFNLEEAELLCGHDNVKDLLERIHNMGPEIVIITDGANGCYASNKEDYYAIKPRKVKVVETTGAGDAFASAFVSGFIKKNDIEFALRLGMVNSEAVIGHIGAKEGLLSYKKALLSMKNPKHKVVKEKLR